MHKKKKDKKPMNIFLGIENYSLWVNIVCAVVDNR